VAGPLLASLGRTWVACAGEAEQASLVPIEVKLGRLGWATRKNWEEKKRPVWPGSPSSWVSAHCQIGIRKSFSFFKSFYNLQTNLNSLQIQISIWKIKYKSASPPKENYASA
jgi:hypothetical protein